MMHESSIKISSRSRTRSRSRSRSNNKGKHLKMKEIVRISEAITVTEITVSV